MFTSAAWAADRTVAKSTIQILPQQVTLTGSQATQRILVELKRDGQYTGDVTKNTKFSSSNPKAARVDFDGTIRAMSDGVATITAKADGQAATVRVRVTGTRFVFAWNFRNHVLPVLTKAGCNSGACHGAAAGKGGLKLSLRGFDPDTDYAVLTRQALGRRVVSGDPAHSLFLLKPTNSLPHGGGKRIESGGQDYRVLAGWITSGMLRPNSHDPNPLNLEVFPSFVSLAPGEKHQILVRANYSDGHSEDVTRWVKFATSDNSVATVDDQGKVNMNGCGEAAITVWFSSRVTFARFVAPYPDRLEPAVFATATRNNFIDDLILKKLAQLNISFSPACSDSEFIRRAFMDTTGVLPTPKETNAFLTDASPDKRIKLIDDLFKRPEYVDYWTYKWSDLFLISSRNLNPTAMKSFYDYLHKCVTDNKPWNRIAREILTAKGSNLDNGAANYYVMHKDPIDLTETTSQAFLGMSITCARCHNHPLEKWTQRDYYQMANLFARVRLKNGDKAGEVLVLASSDGNINLPRLGIPLPPRPLDGVEMKLEGPQDRREKLADWVTASENPYFTKAIVNRVWRNFMGRGLVEAEDDLRQTNPPSNQELLNALAGDFVKSGYDVRHLIRTILSSSTYQRSAMPDNPRLKDERYYSHYIIKRLPAEAILDAMSQVTAIPTEFPNYPKGTRALQLPDSQVASYFLTAFGRPERERTCACERQQEPNVAQALHLSNGDTINVKLRAPGGTIDRMLDANVTLEQAVDQLYLMALCRLPGVEEKRKAVAALEEGTQAERGVPFGNREARRAQLEDLFWAVLSDREFLFNH